MQISFVVLAAALFATAHGLATPLHGIRSAHRHTNIAKARAPAPEPTAPVEFVSRRGLKKRCKARVPDGGLAIPVGVGNAANDPADGGISAGISVALPPPPPTEPAPEPPKATTSNPKPTTTSKPKPTTEPAPQPPSGGGGGGGSHNGQGTFYDTGLTACGVTNNDGEMIVAVSHTLFDSFPGYNGANPNNNPICGKKIKANFKGKSVIVTVTDRCEGCKPDDLDFTPTAFQRLIGDLGLGRVDGVSWDFV